MLREVECFQYVVIHTKDLNTNGLVPASLVVTNLLKQMAGLKAMEKFGYFLGVTKLKTIDNVRKLDNTKFIQFLVKFNCRTLLPKRGEFMIGIVYKIASLGVFLKCGPIKTVYLSARKMPNYYFVNEGKPLFLSNDLSRIEKDVVIRFVVFATEWSQRSCDINILASIDGESLGPVTTAGLDGFEV